MIERPRFVRTLLALAVLCAGASFCITVAIAHSRARLVELPPTIQLRDMRGEFLGEIVGPDGRLGFWPIREIPERMALATLALEDRRLEQHPGVDPIAILRAVRQNVASSQRVSGASTIAMQVARMQDPGPRGLLRKGLEALTALMLTERYGRTAVLAQYLTLAPYGNNIHGVGYAARRYFDKPVDDLSWAETAVLAAVPQAPALRNLATASGRSSARIRARAILDQLLADGTIDEDTHLEAIGELTLAARAERPIRPHASLHAVLAFEKGLAEIPAYAGDPIAETSIDLRLQADVLAILRRAVDAWAGKGAGNAAAVVIDLDTMAVRAVVGSVGYGDAERKGAIDYTRVRRYPGSTLKPLLYAAAIDRGLLSPGEILDDLARGPDGVGNADGNFLGPMLPRRALANSRNVPAVALTREMGLGEVYALLARLDLHDDSLPASHYGLSLAIGGMPTTPLSLARAYGAIATDGQLRDLQWSARAERPAGEPVFSPGVSRWVAIALSDPMARLPTFPRMGNAELPFPAAFKTGTSPDHRDAWTVAFTPDALVVVWVGHPDWRPMDGLSGYRAASRLAREILLSIHPEQGFGLDDRSFPAPEGWSSAQVCPLSGALSGPLCSGSTAEWFPPGKRPSEPCSVHVLQDGHVAVRLPPRYASWLRKSGLQAADPIGDAEGSVELSLLSPVDGAQVARDPDVPPEQSTLSLSVAVRGDAPQVLWLVDGRPYQLAGPPYEVRWPLSPGAHTFQATLPYRPEHSEVVTVFAR